MYSKKPHSRANSPRGEAKLDSKLISMSIGEVRDRLIKLIRAKSLFETDSVLPSGRITGYYLDMKETILSAEGSFLTSMAILQNLKDDVQAIGGSYHGVYSLAAATSQLAYITGQEINTFFVREEHEARKRGYSKWIEGPLKPGAKICVVQDEVITGVDVIETIRKLQDEADAEIVQVITIVDRLDGAKYRFQDYGVDYTAILTMEDIVDQDFA